MFELDIPLHRGKPPLTANQRLHWAEKGRRTRIIRDAVAWRARQAKVPPAQHVTAQLHYQPCDARRRDPSNLYATSKPAIDALQDAGVVPDDDPRYVTEVNPRIHPPVLNQPRRLWLHIEVTT
jgi:crossover junction endodeoxyribonuclease RusA